MGLYLSRYLSGDVGKPKAELPPPAQQCGHWRPRPKRPAFRTLQPAWAEAGAQRALATLAKSPAPCRLPSGLLLRPELSYARLNYVKRRLCAARDPALQGLVRVQVNGPVRPGSLYKCPPPEERPDPCAKETVLQALAQCTKGKRKFDGPLWFEVPEPKTRRPDPEPRASAFQPVTTSGATRTFVPRPGLLGRSCAERNPALEGGR
ncbi:PREDICTED: POM121-like protein 12 [Chinchilla lanigera]|uniref:POM121-like protein 12 n=1 Tax=Chinchilla lanigera TaxID=34839 RepID=UPI00038E9B1D|nr:PREDICTED: POM121-like protein 12 [Chinchilla lanigera]